jgi:hypothetical protein
VNAAMGPWGRQAAVSTTPFPAAGVVGTHPRIASLFQRSRTVQCAFAIVIRPKASPAGQLELHADSCTGPLLERNEKFSASKLNDARDLYIFATGDPRDGQWVLARVAFSK